MFHPAQYTCPAACVTFGGQRQSAAPPARIPGARPCSLMWIFSPGPYFPCSLLCFIGFTQAPVFTALPEHCCCQFTLEMLGELSALQTGNLALPKAGSLKTILAPEGTVTNSQPPPQMDCSLQSSKAGFEMCLITLHILVFVSETAEGVAWPPRDRGGRGG